MIEIFITFGVILLTGLSLTFKTLWGKRDHGSACRCRLQADREAKVSPCDGCHTR